VPETQAKPEIAPQRKVILLPPAIGDWTTYKPPKNYTRRIKSGLYGFDRFSEEKIETALHLHYSLATSLFETIKTDLQTGTEVFSITAEQTNYLNFLRGHTHPLVYCKINSTDLAEPIIACMELTLADSLINHALGMRDLSNPNRQLTELENSVLQSVLDKYVMLLQKAFEGALTDAKFTIINSPDIRVENAMSPSETFVSFQIVASVNGSAPSKLTFGYTGKTLKKLLRKKAEKAQAKPLDLRRIPTEILESIKIPIRVQIGETSISTLDIDHLENGDVVSLDNKLDEAVLIRLGKNIVLSAQPGTNNNHNSIKIVRLGAEERVKIAPALIEESQETPVLDETETGTEEDVLADENKDEAWLKGLENADEDIEFAEEGEKEEKAEEGELKEDWEKDFELESEDKTGKEDDLWK
jgi:flagellar motor switch protein FliM